MFVSPSNIPNFSLRRISPLLIALSLLLIFAMSEFLFEPSYSLTLSRSSSPSSLLPLKDEVDNPGREFNTNGLTVENDTLAEDMLKDLLVCTTFSLYIMNPEFS